MSVAATAATPLPGLAITWTSTAAQGSEVAARSVSMVETLLQCGADSARLVAFIAGADFSAGRNGAEAHLPIGRIQNSHGSFLAGRTLNRMHRHRTRQT